MAKSEAFANGDSATREQMLDAHRATCTAEIRAMVQAEVHGRRPELIDPEVLELERRLAADYPATVVVRPRPTAAKLRFLHRPDYKRSHAYPMNMPPPSAVSALDA